MAICVYKQMTLLYLCTLQMKLLLGLLWTDMLVKRHSHGSDCHWDPVHIVKDHQRVQQKLC